MYQFQLFYIITNTWCCLFHFSHSDTCVYRCLNVALICISLMTKDVEQLYMCIFAIHVSSLLKCHFKSFPVLNWVFLLLSFKNCLYILDLSPLSNIYLANIYSHFVACLFILLQCLSKNRSS